MIANELLTVIEFQRFLRFKKRQGYKKAKTSLKTLFFARQRALITEIHYLCI